MKKYLVIFCLVFSKFSPAASYSEKSARKIPEKKIYESPSTASSFYNFSINYPLNFKKTKYYHELYERILPFPSIGYNHLFLGKEIALGIGFNIAFYSRSGYTAKEGQVGKHENTISRGLQKTNLSLLPYQVLLLLHISPFKDRVVFDIWAGYQELYWEESRTIPDLSSSSTTQEVQSYVNTGWNGHIVVGASLRFLIDFMSKRISSSLERTMKIGNIYLAPFYERSFELNTNELWGKRKISKTKFTYQKAGLAFIFETT